ncbi:MAG: hypothetical protein Q8K60_05295, partial [Parachlamydiaceae bacterium]|nr:hypothetical protein [Parachlamydiaceae bacterium]
MFPFHTLPPLFTNSIFSSLQSYQTITIESHENDSTHFFQFSDADRLLSAFYQKKICDAFGKVTEDYKNYTICPKLKDKNLYEPIIYKLKEILTTNRLILNTRLKICENGFMPVNISCSLQHLFCHIVELSNQKKLTENDLKTFFQIIEIYFIGSSVLPILGKNIFEAITTHHFSHDFSESEIKSWFNQINHINHFFEQKGNDLDTRTLISSDRIEAVSALSDAFLKFLTNKIPEYALTFIKPYYPEKQDNDEILKSFFLSTPAVKNRIKVNCSHSVFALLTIDSDSLPIDLNCVGSIYNEKTKENETILEFPNLTSLNSLYLPIKQFLTDPSLESFSFFSRPFGIQVLFDLLFNCATPTTHNQFGWRYFLRKYYRMMDPDDEKKMIQEVLKFYLKNDFSSISKHNFLPESNDIKTIGGFIYLLLANDFLKFETEIPSDPFILAEYLFRACLSLTTYSEMNDHDCKKLWECVDKYYWNPLGRSSNNNSIYSSIREAILKDHIPFSVLSAYINILGYLWHPESTTTHCHVPVIALKKPFTVFLPIRLQMDCETIDHYFSKHPFPSSLNKIFTSFVQSSDLSLIKFPLIPYFKRLNINPHLLNNTLKKWINLHSSHLQLIGLQIYLSFNSTIPEPSFVFIESIYKLPSIFSYLETWQQKQAIIAALINLADQNFDEAIPLMIHFYQFNFKNSSPIQWVNLLLEVNTDYSNKIAYEYFKNNKNYFLKSIHRKECWHIFQGLLSIDVYSALDLFYLLMKRVPLRTENQFIDALIALLTQFKKLNPLTEPHLQLKIIKVFQLFFDVPKEDIEFKYHQLEFSKLLFFYLKILYSNPIFEQDTDYFLLESCRREYLTRTHRASLWSLRIEYLINQNRAQDGAIFYQLIIENKWIQPSQLILKNPLNNSKTLIESLLK